MKDAKAALKQFVQRHISWQVITGKVIAVDDETCDIDPADGGTTFHKVRLKPAVNGDDLGTIIYPKVGSECTFVVCNGDANSAQLWNAEKVDRILWKIEGGAQIEVKNDGTLELNGDQYGGLVKQQELKDQLAKLNAFMQNVQQAFTSWVTVPNDGGAALKANSSQFTSLTRPDFSNIDSDKTKHGSL